MRTCAVSMNPMDKGKQNRAIPLWNTIIFAHFNWAVESNHRLTPDTIFVWSSRLVIKMVCKLYHPKKKQGESELIMEIRSHFLSKNEIKKDMEWCSMNDSRLITQSKNARTKRRRVCPSEREMKRYVRIRNTHCNQIKIFADANQFNDAENLFHWNIPNDMHGRQAGKQANINARAHTLPISAELYCHSVRTHIHLFSASVFVSFFSQSVVTVFVSVYLL